MNDKILQIEECVKLFPKLEEGLDINTKFSDACDFVENPGYRMFSHYGFKLFHGWVVDPNHKELHKLINNKSYDETIDFLISDAKEYEKEIVRKFLTESATQLTSYGLLRLYALMDEDVLAILFRNNYFSTIVKHAGIVYELVTEEGIVDTHPQIMWRQLQIRGSYEFADERFDQLPWCYIEKIISTCMIQDSYDSQITQYNRMKTKAENGVIDGIELKFLTNRHKL